MAITSYATGDALAVKAWARGLAEEVRKGLEIGPLIGKSKNSIIQEKTELKSSGDRVRIGLRLQLTGAGTTEGQALEGNEEALSTHYDDIMINELHHAVRVEGEDSIDQQRVLHNLRGEARDGLKDWFAERQSLSFFVQMGGYTADTMTYRGSSITMSTVYQGLNTVTAPSTNRKKTVGVNANDEDLDSSDTITLSEVTKLKEMAMTANPRVRPVRINGGNKYVLYLHPYQVTDLKLDAQASGSVSWADIQLAAMKGGEISGNALYTGALGEYDGVILRENEDVVTGVNSSTGAEITTVRRALFLGAQSAGYVSSSKFSKKHPYKWVEDKFDYDRELGVSVQSLCGIKKLIFNSEDFGAIVLSSYAAAHTG